MTDEEMVAYRARTAELRAEADTYRAASAAMLARHQVAWIEVLAADHEAAIAEDTDRGERLAAERRAEYRAYLCSMYAHGCACVALGFDEWVRVGVRS
jgi:hypothetical protein